VWHENTFLRVRRPQGRIRDVVLTAQVPDGSNPLWRSLPFTRACLSDVRVIVAIYACSFGGVAMSDYDGTDSSTQVPTVMCVWVPVAVSYHARHSMPLSPEDPTPVALLITKSPRVWLLGTRVHFELGHEVGL
jgi:hypothetical protein